MRKLEHLEGLRGLAAFFVVIAHYLQFYYLDAFFKNPNTSLEIMLSKTPLNLIYNGNFAVCIFFLLSGFVLSLKFVQTKDHDVLVASSVKRYPRLVIPVFFSVLIAYTLLRLDAYEYFTHYTKDLRYENMNENFFAMLKMVFFDVFFAYGKSYNAVLWTMTYELFGSFIVFSFLALFGKVKNRFIVYLLLIVIFFDSYFLAFILGLILSDWSANRDRSIPKPIIFICLMIGIFLGSYPYGGTENTIYSFLNVEFLNVDYRIFYHITGAFFIMLAMLQSTLLKNIFSKKLFSFLGKISFSLYLTHFPILASLSFFLFDKLIDSYSYNISFIIAFTISIVLTFVISYVMYIFVDKKAVHLSKVIYIKLFPNK